VLRWWTVADTQRGDGSRPDVDRPEAAPPTAKPATARGAAARPRTGRSGATQSGASQSGATQSGATQAGATQAGGTQSNAPHWSRTAGGISSLIAAAVFIFGVGNLTDLKDRFTGKDAGRRVEQQIARANHSIALSSQLELVSAACASAGGNATVPKKITVSWLDTMLDARTRFANTWAVGSVRGLSDTEQADMAAARSRFRAATGYWAAVTHDYKVRDVSAYDAHLGDYYAAMAGYLDTLHRYGLHDGCPVSWAPPPFWQS
jgi:hypothetical protein